jgi:dTDP-4-dehydrorhamnose reductase
MEQLKVLILGDGLLGSEIVKQTNWDYMSRKKDGFNISDPSSWNFNNYNIIINCIANTDTYSTDKQKHWDVNYKFVYDLANYCNDNNIKLVHISTEYLYSGSISNATEEDVPVHCNNWYGYTKLLGDGIVQLISKDYLLIRCMHKPNPFPYDKAWIDQIGNFDYVDVITSMIINLVKRGDCGLYNVGTKLKSIYDLAKKTNIGVLPILSPQNAPKDITMDISKLKN